MDEVTRKSWNNFLDPNLLRRQLTIASVYIAVFELLKDVLIDRIGSFFADSYDASGWVASPAYQAEVLSRNKSVVYASLDWLRFMEAISDQDIQEFDRLKKCRNHIVHNMFIVLASTGLPPDVGERFEEMRKLIRKVELWWIVNIEVDVNPDLVGTEFDPESVTSGTEIGTALLGDIAFGEGQLSASVYEQFKKLFGDAK